MFTTENLVICLDCHLHHREILEKIQGESEFNTDERKLHKQILIPEHFHWLVPIAAIIA
jgi:hypothetical protein